MPPSRRALAGLVVLVLTVMGLQTVWTRVQADRVGERLAAVVRPGDLQMLSSDTCVVCERARRWFREQDVPFSECSIERDAACAARYATLGSALGMVGTPIILVRGVPMLGFSPEALVRHLDG